MSTIEDCMKRHRPIKEDKRNADSMSMGCKGELWRDIKSRWKFTDGRNPLCRWHRRISGSVNFSTAPQRTLRCIQRKLLLERNNIAWRRILFRDNSDKTQFIFHWVILEGHNPDLASLLYNCYNNYNKNNTCPSLFLQLLIIIITVTLCAVIIVDNGILKWIFKSL